MAITLIPGAAAHRAHVAELVWSTGPASYAYIFGGRAPFTQFVERSWVMSETLRLAKPLDRSVA